MITDSGSVLILGAGVSAPFDIPLGGALIGMIARSIASERATLFSRTEDDFHGSNRRQRIHQAVWAVDGFSRLPVYGAVAAAWVPSRWQDENLKELNADFQRLEELERLLENQTSETIDDFIVENPKYADLTKAAVAALLLKRCHSFEDRSYTPNNFERRIIGAQGERNWIHLLINIVRHGIRRGSVSSKNKVRIVTFNYDTILEYVLDKQFSNTEAGYGNYADFIEIVHVHGQFSPLAQASERPSFVAREWAKGISVVNESAPASAVAEARKRARALIRSAEKVYCVGFSFAGPNCRLLGLDAQPREFNRTLSFCNYDGNVGVKKSAERYQFGGVPGTTLEEAAGSRDRPLSVEDWFRAGYVGELPG